MAGTFTWHAAGLTKQRKFLGRCTLLSMKRYAWLCVPGGEVAYFICLFGGYLPMCTERAMEIHKALGLIHDSQPAASAGRTSARKKSLTSSGESLLRLSTHQSNTRMKVDATY